MKLGKRLAVLFLSGLMVSSLVACGDINYTMTLNNIGDGYFIQSVALDVTEEEDYDKNVNKLDEVTIKTYKDKGIDIEELRYTKDNREYYGVKFSYDFESIADGNAKYRLLSDMNETDGNSYINSSVETTPFEMLYVNDKDQLVFTNTKTGEKLNYFELADGITGEFAITLPGTLISSNAKEVTDSTFKWDVTAVEVYACTQLSKTQAESLRKAVLTTWVEPEPIAFKDLDGHWAKEYMLRLYDSHILNGVSADRMEPDGELTRAQMAAILHRSFEELFSVDDGAPNKVFTDVDSSKWYYDDVNWVSKFLIMNGTSEKEFSPNGMLTREQLAVIMANVDKGRQHQVAYDIKVNDIDKCGDWSRDSVIHCEKLGLLEKLKDENNNYNPKSVATRADISYILCSYFTLV